MAGAVLETHVEVIVETGVVARNPVTAHDVLVIAAGGDRARLRPIEQVPGGGNQVKESGRRDHEDADRGPAHGVSFFTVGAAVAGLFRGAQVSQGRDDRDDPADHDDEPAQHRRMVLVSMPVP